MQIDTRLHAASSDATHTALPTHDAVELTNGGSLANIRLDDQMYVLRITRAGKLILTK
ncbi:hemin uptake protein HemP [Arenibacterium halophilum]|uniref:Hemin uptake protein HemP n=1 Tax=Arenibacterium halophilum TaxID=2583821 RepID=A0ABY2XAG2_9RHOB|nr:hemin uptake protein HemP [Arenibacterium halophilum]MEC7256686.1 hemin uptake protein HemP [Pseudomonadota bacterium]TMV13365.1 hemin uptake protein HemP [Arenibacterium halophilum]